MAMERNYLIAIALAAILIAAGYIYVSSTPGTAPTPTLTPATPTPAARTVASRGDMVWVDYTVRVENGSVYDTTLEQVARDAGIYKSTIRYTPFNFTLGSADMIDGFNEAVLGMRVGEEKNAIIPPDKAYGAYDPTLVDAIPRIYSLQRVEPVPMDEFLQIYPGFTFSENETLLVGSWNATILAATNNSVMLRHDPQVNQTLATGKWPETVVNVTDTEIVLRRDPKLGAMYLTEDAMGEPLLGTVRTIADDYFMLDYNAPLAGHALNFTLRLVRIS